MGLIRNCCAFLLGIYVAQNYNVPDLKLYARMAIAAGRQYEENYRNSKKKPTDSD